MRALVRRSGAQPLKGTALAQRRRPDGRCGARFWVRRGRPGEAAGSLKFESLFDCTIAEASLGRLAARRTD